MNSDFETGPLRINRVLGTIGQGPLLQFQDEAVQAVDPVQVRLKILQKRFCLIEGLKELHYLKNRWVEIGTVNRFIARVMV